MNKESERLSTFKHPNWSLSWLNVELLAATGLFYLGKSDKVQCFSCKIVIFKWTKDDDIIEEHKHWSPSCPFLLRNYTDNIPINEARLEEILPSCFHLMNTSRRSFIFIDNVMMNMNKSNLQVPAKYACMSSEELRCETFNRYNTLISHKFLLSSSGFFYSSIECAVKCFSCGIKFKDVLTLEDVKQICKKHEAESCAYIKLKTLDSTIGEESNNTINNLEELGENRLCKICFGKSANIAFLPCGHVAACLRCGSLLRRCPICNMQHCGLLRLYFS